ncbi:MAG TPA: ACP phosphodiesterase [Gemmata sp.]|nr:ACP phosphodiesterase [Gemmata sp.]
MNFLAHLHLAAPDPGLMLGGVVADFARNPEIEVLPADVRRGVRLHRLIDGFTDRHAVVQKSISRVSSRLGWFTGIVIDIYYDHILARDWSRYAAVPLREFADQSYLTLEDQHTVTPPDARHFIRRMIETDQLVGYSTPEGLATTLARVSRRIAERIPKRAIWLPDALPDLAAADPDLAADFHDFYPELIAFAAATRRDLE